MNALIEAIKVTIGNCPLIPWGVYDTMAPPGPGGGADHYPYLVLTVIDLPDESNWRNSAEMFDFRIDVLTAEDRGTERSSGRLVGTISRYVLRCLDGRRVTDLTGVYQPFWPELQAFRRLKEEQNVWHIGMDFRAFVTLV